MAPSLMASSTAISISFSSSGRGRAIIVADHQVADLRSADVGPEVDAASLLDQSLEILFQRTPIGSHVKVLLDIGALGIEFVVGGRDRSAFAGDLGGHALGQFADRLLIDEQVELGLPQHVDEAGRDDQSGGIDGALRFHAGTSAANKRNAVADDADVGISPRVSAAVDQASVANEHVELLREPNGCNHQKQERHCQ